MNDYLNYASALDRRAERCAAGSLQRSLFLDFAQQWRILAQQAMDLDADLEAPIIPDQEIDQSTPGWRPTS